MNRRQALQLFSVGITGVTTFAVSDANAQHANHGDEPADIYRECAAACAACVISCEADFRHCAGHVADGHKSHLKCMNLCADCGEVCAMAAKIVARQGPLSAAACEACATACDTCAAECEKFPDDRSMAACARTCRQCSKACRKMLDHLRAR